MNIRASYLYNGNPVLLKHYFHFEQASSMKHEGIYMDLYLYRTLHVITYTRR